MSESSNVLLRVFLYASTSWRGKLEFVLFVSSTKFFFLPTLILISWIFQYFSDFSHKTFQLFMTPNLMSFQTLGAHERHLCSTLAFLTILESRMNVLWSKARSDSFYFYGVHVLLYCVLSFAEQTSSEHKIASTKILDTNKRNMRMSTNWGASHIALNLQLLVFLLSFSSSGH